MAIHPYFSLQKYMLIILSVLGKKVKREESIDFERFHSVLSVLSYMLKAPVVPPGTR